MNDWTDAEQHANRAVDLLESGRLAEAEAALRHALAIDADQPEWHHQLGMILEMGGRDVEAIESFDRAAAASPEASDHVAAAATACMRLGDHHRGEERLVTLTRLRPDDEDVWSRLIEVQATQGRHDEAETTFYLAEMSLDRTSAACLVSLAESLLERRSLDKAIWCLEEAIRLEPARLQAHQCLAEMKASMGHSQEAMKTYRWLLQQPPVDVSVALSYAELLLVEDRVDEACGVLRQVLEQDPVNAEAHYQLGLLAMSQGQFQQSALAFQLVRRLDRNHRECDRSLAESLLRLGQIGDARRLLSLAAQRLRDSGDTDENDASLERFGHLLLGVDLASDATEVFERLAHRRGWSDVNVLRPLARSRFLAGDIQGGRTISRRILRIRPTCAASISNLAFASIRQGRVREAAGWIQRGLREHPRDEVLRQLRFKLLLHSGAAVFKRILGLGTSQTPPGDSAPGD